MGVAAQKVNQNLPNSGANNPYLPENLTEDFDMKPWLDSIFKPEFGRIW